MQVHFTLEGEGLRAQRNYHEGEVYMDSQHGIPKTMVHIFSEFACGPPPKGRHAANYDRSCQWCNLCMRVKDHHNHNHMVMALGSCVKWPLVWDD